MSCRTCSGSVNTEGLALQRINCYPPDKFTLYAVDNFSHASNNQTPDKNPSKQGKSHVEIVSKSGNNHFGLKIVYLNKVCTSLSDFDLKMSGNSVFETNE